MDLGFRGFGVYGFGVQGLGFRLKEDDEDFFSFLLGLTCGFWDAAGTVRASASSSSMVRKQRPG